MSTPATSITDRMPRTVRAIDRYRGTGRGSRTAVADAVLAELPSLGWEAPESLLRAAENLTKAKRLVTTTTERREALELALVEAAVRFVEGASA